MGVNPEDIVGFLEDEVIPVQERMLLLAVGSKGQTFFSCKTSFFASLVERFNGEATADILYLTSPAAGLLQKFVVSDSYDENLLRRVLSVDAGVGPAITTSIVQASMELGSEAKIEILEALIALFSSAKVSKKLKMQLLDHKSILCILESSNRFPKLVGAVLDLIHMVREDFSPVNGVTVNKGYSDFVKAWLANINTQACMDSGSLSSYRPFCVAMQTLKLVVSTWVGGVTIPVAAAAA